MRSIDVATCIFIVALTVAEFWLYFICQAQAELKGEKSFPALMRSVIISCSTACIVNLVKDLSPEYGQFYAAFFFLGRGILFLFCWGSVRLLSQIWRVIRDSFGWKRWRLICRMFGMVESVLGVFFLGVAYVLKISDNLAFAGSWAPWIMILGLLAILCCVVMFTRAYIWYRKRREQRMVSRKEDPPTLLMEGENGGSV